MVTTNLDYPTVTLMRGRQKSKPQIRSQCEETVNQLWEDASGAPQGFLQLQRRHSAHLKCYVYNFTEIILYIIVLNLVLLKNSSLVFCELCKVKQLSKKLNSWINSYIVVALTKVPKKTPFRFTLIIFNIEVVFCFHCMIKFDQNSQVLCYSQIIELNVLDHRRLGEQQGLLGNLGTKISELFQFLCSDLFSPWWQWQF